MLCIALEPVLPLEVVPVAEPDVLLLRSTSVSAYIAPVLPLERLVELLLPGIDIAPSHGLTQPVSVTVVPRPCMVLLLCDDDVGFCAAATERPANASPMQTAGIVRVIALFLLRERPSLACKSIAAAGCAPCVKWGSRIGARHVQLRHALSLWVSARFVVVGRCSLQPGQPNGTMVVLRQEHSTRLPSARPVEDAARAGTRGAPFAASA